MELLVEKKADINKARTVDGCTPLIAATLNGNEKIVEILIRNKAKINQAKTDDGVTPLIIAVYNNDMRIT